MCAVRLAKRVNHVRDFVGRIVSIAAFGFAKLLAGQPVHLSAS